MANLGFNLSEMGLNLSVYTGTKIFEESSSMLNGIESTAIGAANALTAQLNAEMQALITQGIDKIYNSVGLTDSNIAFAKTLLNTAGGAITKVTQIIEAVPVDLTCIPSVKATLSAAASSFKQVALCMFMDAMLIYDQTVNVVITQLALPMELLVAAVFMVVEKIEAMVDEQVYQYTGYHLVEILNLCVKGRQLINQMKEAKKKKSANNDNASSNNSGDTGISNSSGTSTSVGVDVDVEKLKQDSFNKVREQLYSYLDSIATPLYNAFIMLLLKETVLTIRFTFEKMVDVDINTLALNMESIDDVINVIEESIGPNPTIVSIADIKALGLNNMFAAAALMKLAIDNAKNTDALLANMNAGQLIGAASSTVSVNVSKNKTYTIEVGEIDDDGTTNFTLTLYTNVKNATKGLNSNLKNIKHDNQQIIPNVEISRFLDELKIMWNNNQGGDIILEGMVDGLVRRYAFHVTIVHEEPETPADSSTNEEKPDKLDISLPDSINDKIDNIAAAITDLKGNTEIISDGKKQKIVFDIINSVLAMLKPVIPLLQQIAHYIENYKINKAKVQAHARGCLHISLLDMLKNLGLDKLFDDDNGNTSDNNGNDSGNLSENGADDNDSTSKGKSNFYTVRTRKLNNYLKGNYIQPESNGCTTITAKLTSLMVIDCALIADMSSLDPKLQTVLYFDSEAIQEEERLYNETLRTGTKPERNGIAYKDGTTTGLDTVQIDHYTGDIYISKSGRSTDTSEIYRAMRRKYDYRK